MDFEYLAYNKDKQLLKGNVTADSEEAAIEILTPSGLRIVSIKKTSTLFNMEKLADAFIAIKAKEVVMFARQLALLLESGTDIIAALDVLQAQIPNKGFRKMVTEIMNDVRAGARLSQAMLKQPKAFNRLFCRTMAVGEETGNMEQVLRQMADYTEKQAIAAGKVKGAMIYPLIIVLLVVAVIAVMAFFVMPNFMGLYDALGADLPAVTMALLFVTNIILNYWWIMVLASLGIGIASFIYVKTPAGSYRWDSAKLKIPLVGPVTLYSELGRCASTISTLFRAGLPLPEIMTMVIDNSGNQVISNALTSVRTEMLKGQGLARPMAQHSVFPALLVQMAAVGEGTGNLDATMETVAQSYEMEAADRTSALIAAIQPITTVIMGGIVAFIAIALVSSMYGVMGQIQG